MAKPGTSGVVIPVPAADPLLQRVRDRHPGTVRDVPAHVSVLYPFVDAGALDDAATRTLTGIFAEQAQAEVTFAECRREPGFVYLAPEQAGFLAGLTGAVRRHWPGLVPYGGAFGDPPPHLTVTMGVSEPLADTIRQDVEPLLPVRTRVTEAWLVVLTDRWTVRARFPFAGGLRRRPLG